jgi:hypothetical protein
MPLPAAKADLVFLFDFSTGKIIDVLQPIHLRFFALKNHRLPHPSFSPDGRGF